MADQQKLLNAIDAAEENSYGSDSNGALASDRAAAIDAYLGKNSMPAPDGRSQVVDRTVYETVQWIMPSLCAIFANGDDVVELPPIGPEDEQPAKQEAAYLNYLLLQRNNWFQVFNTGAKDGLLTKAGYLYAYKDKKRQVEVEKYERQTQEGVALLMQDQPEIINVSEYPDPDAQPQQQIDPMTGQPVLVPPPMLYDIELRRVKEDTVYCVKALPPERVKVSQNCTDVQVRDSDYFEYYDDVTISDLRAMGYDVADDIAQGDDDDSEEREARDQYSERGWQDGNPIDPAMRRVKCRWVWIRHDYDDDGISELQYVVRVGNEILHREEVNSIPIGVLCPDPLPHRHIGLSVADTTLDIQNIKTAILRQGLDNLYLTNNQRTYVNPDRVNVDDLIKSRPGGVVRGKGTFGVDIAPMPTPFVFPQAVEGLAYMEQVTEGRTGVNRYFQGTDQNALNKTATGIQQLSTMAAQRVQQVARSYANGIEVLVSVLHELVLKGGHQKEVVKLRGKWEQIDPSTWRRRSDFRISVGYASGNKDASVSRLMMIAQLQEKAMAGGLPIVQPQNIYETAIELTKASDFAAPERFWTEPSKAPERGPPQPDPTIMAAEQLKAQASLQGKQMETEQRERDSQRDFEVKKYQIDTDAQVKLTIANQQATQAREVEQFRAGEARSMKELDAQLKFDPEVAKEVAKDKERKRLEDEIAKREQAAAQANAEADAMRKALETISSAPRRLKRGKDGKAEAVELLDENGNVMLSKQVVRGPDGRVAGAV